MRLLKEGHSITGIDCLDDYYDVRLKRARLERLMAYPGFRFSSLICAPGRSSSRRLQKTIPASSFTSRRGSA